MPRVLSYTPKWLSRPSPGFDLFSPSARKASKALPPGPNATIAHRDTEVFVAVGNEIRWADLVVLKEREESKSKRKFSRGRAQDFEDEYEDIPAFKTLKIAIHNPITSLTLSTDGSMLAIATTHTVHVAVLPHSSELTTPDSGPVKCKRDFRIGPTTHVSETSPLRAVLWHPLSANHNCLVTVTENAEVRLWELNEENVYHSSEEPTLAIDLLKLQEAKSTDDDVKVRPSFTGKRYSADELPVASACFGGNGKTYAGWPEMTLYITTYDGDVYALCPLLPTKFRAVPGAMDSISLEIASKQSALGADATEAEKYQVKQQAKWLEEINGQELQKVVKTRSHEEIEVLNRPSKPDIKPRLQGPFYLSDDTLEEDERITDMYVINLQADSTQDEASVGDFRLEDELPESLSAAAIALATDQGNVHICLDLEGVGPRWLPSAGRGHEGSEDFERELLSYETIQVVDAETPVKITPDTVSPYAFFVTHAQGISFISLDWLSGLISELADPVEQGSALRINTFLDSASTLTETLLNIPAPPIGNQTTNITAAIVLQDSDLGYVLLTSTSGQPYYLIFDQPEPEKPILSIYDSHLDTNSQLLPAPRPTYTPPAIFSQPTNTFLAQIHSKIPARRKALLTEPIAFSPATIEILTEAHRLLSNETAQLRAAVAELFRECERLVNEMRGAVGRVAEANERIARLVDEEEEGPLAGESMRVRLERRVQGAIERQRTLFSRCEAIRLKTRSDGRELSDKERAYIADVEKFATELDKRSERSESGRGGVRGGDQKLLRRFEEVKKYKDDLMKEAKEVTEGAEGDADAGKKAWVPTEVRRQKKREVEDMLERQEALVEAAREKLERLGVVG